MTLHAASNGIMSCIGRIMRCQDRPGIEEAIEAVERINDELSAETGTEPADVRRLIREGVGCFGDIQTKCKLMGVV